MGRECAICGGICPTCSGAVPRDGQAAQDLAWGVMLAESRPELSRYWKTMIAADAYSRGRHEPSSEPLLDLWVSEGAALATARYTPSWFVQAAPDAAYFLDERVAPLDVRDYLARASPNRGEMSTAEELSSYASFWSDVLAQEEEPAGAPRRDDGGAPAGAGSEEGKAEEPLGPEEDGLEDLPRKNYGPEDPPDPITRVLRWGRFAVRPRCCVQRFRYPKRWDPDTESGHQTASQGDPPEEAKLRCFGSTENWLDKLPWGASFESRLTSGGCHFFMLDTPGGFVDRPSEGSVHFAWVGNFLGLIWDRCRNKVRRLKGFEASWEGEVGSAGPADPNGDPLERPSIKVRRLGSDSTIGDVQEDGTEVRDS